MEKVPAQAWFIGLVHFLRGGVFAPILFSLVISFPILFFIKVNSPEWTSIAQLLLGAPLLILGFYLGSVYSARYINRRYTFDPMVVTQYATVYLVVLFIVRYFYRYMYTSVEISIPATLVDTVATLVGIFVFYRTSKKSFEVSGMRRDDATVANNL